MPPLLDRVLSALGLGSESPGLSGRVDALTRKVGDMESALAGLKREVGEMGQSVLKIIAKVDELAQGRPDDAELQALSGELNGMQESIQAALDRVGGTGDTGGGESEA